MASNIENIRVEAMVYANQTSIFIVNCVKMPKASLSLSPLFTRWCFKFTRDHVRYTKISQAEPGFLQKVYLLLKKTTDYMKYSSKITENRVCKDLINWKQTEQACDWIKRKAIRSEKTTIEVVLKKINTFGQKLMSMKSLPALDVAF